MPSDMPDDLDPEEARRRLDGEIDAHRSSGFELERRGDAVAVLSRRLGMDQVERVELVIDEEGRTERFAIRGRRSEVDAAPLDPGVAFQLGDDIVVRDYPGRSQADASRLYAREVEWATLCGYQPVAQSWGEGRPGMARMVTLGLFSAVAKPKGVLTVTYRLESAGDGTKVCPDCAEEVKAAARICRFCRYEFPVD